MYNKRIRKYIRAALRTQTAKAILLDLEGRKITKFNKYAISYLKEIAIDYTRCPYCNNEYDNYHIFTDVGNEFKDDGIFVCCHNCAIEAGLHIC